MEFSAGSRGKRRSCLSFSSFRSYRRSTAWIEACLRWNVQRIRSTRGEPLEKVFRSSVLFRKRFTFLIVRRPQLATVQRQSHERTNFLEDQRNECLRIPTRASSSRPKTNSLSLFFFFFSLQVFYTPSPCTHRACLRISQINGKSLNRMVESEDVIAAF